ncbi:hypothetical protein SVIOM74S_09890 [Streptomyces violarus]
MSEAACAQDLGGRVAQQTVCALAPLGERAVGGDDGTGGHAIVERLVRTHRRHSIRTLTVIREVA